MGPQWGRAKRIRRVQEHKRIVLAVGARSPGDPRRQGVSTRYNRPKPKECGRPWFSAHPEPVEGRADAGVAITQAKSLGLTPSVRRLGQNEPAWSLQSRRGRRSYDIFQGLGRSSSRYLLHRPETGLLQPSGRLSPVLSPLPRPGERVRVRGGSGGRCRRHSFVASKGSTPAPTVIPHGAPPHPDPLPLWGRGGSRAKAVHGVVQSLVHGWVHPKVDNPVDSVDPTHPPHLYFLRLCKSRFGLTTRSMKSLPSRWSISCWIARASNPSVSITTGLPSRSLAASFTETARTTSAV